MLPPVAPHPLLPTLLTHWPTAPRWHSTRHHKLSELPTHPHTVAILPTSTTSRVVSSSSSAHLKPGSTQQQKYWVLIILSAPIRSLGEVIFQITFWLQSVYADQQSKYCIVEVDFQIHTNPAWLLLSLRQDKIIQRVGKITSFSEAGNDPLASHRTIGRWNPLTD